MWIVRLALRRPYTFVVMALLIVALGIGAILRMPADIFPEINIPVVSVIWSYAGISAAEMSDVVTIRSERGFTTSVNDIEHIESQSLAGLSVIKIFFHPNAKVEAAVAQISAATGSMLHILPPGMSPPAIIRYNASSVPILQLGVSSDSMPEQALYDYSTNFLRTQMSTVQGGSFPSPYGGKPRQIMVDLQPEKLYAQGLSPMDIVNALNNQNLILPAGAVKIGEREFAVRLNGMPDAASLFNDLPIKQINGSTVYMRDVAHVRDGYQVQTNIVRHNGSRGALLTVLKNGGASTLDIVARIKEILPRIQSTLPKAMNVKLLFDQSIFVRAAIEGVLKEAATAAALTALMILLFLGSWRSTVIVCVSIPLSILTSLAIMHLMNETVNVMTLGGLALAVGILVDDATVEIENIHRNLAQGKPIIRAILDGAQQIAVPAFVSTLCICIVFVPVIFLTGAARYLFTPLALAVVLAMMASYFLSRTLVPTMVHFLLAAEVDRYSHGEEETNRADDNLFWRAHHAFNRQFHRLREAYRELLISAIDHPRIVAACFLLLCVISGALGPFLGRDFFPQVDAGQIRLHVRAPAGTRIEQTEVDFAKVENTIRALISTHDLGDILDNIGLPYSGSSLAYSDSGTVGSFDGEILVSLNPHEHHPTWDYVRQLRKKLNRDYPEMTFFFQPADIVGQTLNFGLPAPIDIQVIGPLSNEHANYRMAQEIERKIKRIAGTADVHIHQVVDVPEMRFAVDRVRADQMGMTQKDVANSMLVSMGSSRDIAPNYWINPQNGVDYPVVVQTPTIQLDSTATMLSTPIRSTGTQAPQLLANIAGLTRGSAAAIVNHYNVQPLYDIYANVQDRDLGGVAGEVSTLLDNLRPKLPKGSFFEMRGQVETMRTSFIGLSVGLVFAIMLVYFLMVVNFQSWLDPFIILMALPGALAGILVMLFLTQTTLNVPSLMGAIMSIGVATANSILLVTFANDVRLQGEDARTAAVQAGFTRLRPVIMTALAMIVGMLPMAVGLGGGRGTECAAGTSGDWRLVDGDRGNAVLCSGGVFGVAQESAVPGGRRGDAVGRGRDLKIEERPAEVLVVRPRKKRVRPLLTFFAILGLCVMAAIVAGMLPRLRREKVLDESVASVENDKRVVNVAIARQAPLNSALELPADLLADIETPIFARADGYLVKRYVDIGDQVKAGQAMADIETPELDQQIDQARATLANSKSGLSEAQSNLILANANLKLSQKTFDRWQQLEGKGTVSHQEADEKGATRDVQVAQVEAAQAKISSARELVSANEANLRRLEQLKAYSKVAAPFTGVVTSRTVDVGTLINAGNGGVSKEMFRVAQTGIMRVFVNVPQAYVSSIKPGVPAELRVQELPGQVFRATVQRITGAIDPGSRSMLAIVVIPNPTGVLKSGMYTQVRFASARALPALLIPGDALVSGAKGTQVAVVDHSDVVHFRDVKVGTDLGSEVEVVSGLSVGDRVVTNPSDAVHDGTAVEVHQAATKN